MDEIIIYNIEGGLSEFLAFIEEKADEQEYRGKFEVKPLFKTDEETLGAELVQVILFGTATLIPLIIKIWEIYREDKRSPNSSFIRIEFKKDGQTTSIVEGENLTIEQVKQLLQIEQNEDTRKDVSAAIQSHPVIHVTVKNSIVTGSTLVAGNGNSIFSTFPAANSV